VAIKLFSKFQRKVDETDKSKLTEEIALAGSNNINWTGMVGSYNPDEIGIATYKEMLKDCTVKAGYSLIKYAILSRGWKISYTNEKGDLKVLSTVSHILDNMDGRLEGALSGIVSALIYGFSVSEIVWKIIESGEFAGKFGIKKIKCLDPEHIEFVCDEFGNLEDIKQCFDASNPISIPLEKAIIYVNEKEFGNYYGTSRLRAVYKNWYIKKAVTTYWNIALERFGCPMLIGTVPNSQDLDKMTTILDNIQMKSSIAKTAGWEISALETGVGRSSGGDFRGAMEYHDEQILKGLLLPPILINTPKSGSYALSSTQFSMFQLVLQNLENDLSTLLEEYLIKPIVTYNFGEQDVYPQFNFMPLTKDDLLNLSKVFALLVKNGVVGTDEGWMRDMMGIPHRDVAEITRDKVDPQQKENVPPPTKSQQVKVPEVDRKNWQG
jgi:hypothetical protein